ncbi:MAG: hypothetical protein SH850_27745 [Planctomycetaceae bacterium]|nr:hypothetical protein [Planctomycetaceae bacterium]
MTIRSLLSKRIARWLAAVAVSLTLVLIALGVFFRISSTRHLIAYQAMPRECHPIWRELAWRRINLGDSVEDVLIRFPPSLSEEFGDYGHYVFFRETFHDEGGLHFTGVSITAKRGRLINAEAWSCTWELPFFGHDDAEFLAALQAHTHDRNRVFRQHPEESP